MVGKYVVGWRLKNIGKGGFRHDRDYVVNICNLPVSTCNGKCFDF